MTTWKGVEEASKGGGGRCIGRDDSTTTTTTTTRSRQTISQVRTFFPRSPPFPPQVGRFKADFNDWRGRGLRRFWIAFETIIVVVGHSIDRSIRGAKIIT